MDCNIAGWNRGAPIVAGLTLLVLGWLGVAGGALGLLLKVLAFNTLGAAPLMTGIMAYCPLCEVLAAAARRG